MKLTVTFSEVKTYTYEIEVENEKEAAEIIRRVNREVQEDNELGCDESDTSNDDLLYSYLQTDYFETTEVIDENNNDITYKIQP